MKNIGSMNCDLFWKHRVQQGLALVLFCIFAAASHAQETAQPVESAINMHPKTPLDANRLWVPPRQSAFADLLLTAANLALEHPDCAEVLYGALNEYRTEREGTSFTIMCIKDARTTFNQIFFASDLPGNQTQTPEGGVAPEAEIERRRESERRAEIERLRQLIPGGQQAPAPVQQQ